MTQRKFMLLLNLYIDGEIPPTLAVELETEIIANPKRRKIYDDYCRIHRSTKLVYERFREAAVSPDIEKVRLFDAPPTGASHVRGVEGGVHPSRKTVVRWLGGAAAACVAGVFSLQLMSDRHPAEVPVAIISAPEAAIALAAADEERSIAAPFAAETRADPYVAQEQTPRSSPFSLTSNPAELHFVWPSGEVAGESRIQSPFGMVRLEMVPFEQAPLREIESPLKAAGIFRASEPDRPTELTPASLSIDR